MWIRFPGGGNNPYDFARDGQWHTISIPVAELREMANLNLHEVHQVFQVLGVGGPLNNLAIDNIYFSGGQTASRDRWAIAELPSTAPVALAIRRRAATDIELSFPSQVGRSYQMYVSIDGMASWNAYGDPVAGTGDTLTLTHPGGLPAPDDAVFYRVGISD